MSAIATLEAQTHLPFILTDSEGIIRRVNALFEAVYGWSAAEVIGQPLSLVLPHSFRDSHHLAFSRFLLTEQSTILNHPLRLLTRCYDGREVESEHFIVAEKQGDSWCFAATLRPLSESMDAHESRA